jgi:hypothetical protein
LYVRKKNWTSTDPSRIFCCHIIKKSHEDCFQLQTEHRIFDRHFPASDMNPVSPLIASSINIPTNTCKITLNQAMSLSSTACFLPVSCNCKADCSRMQCSCQKKLYELLSFQKLCCYMYKYSTSRREKLPKSYWMGEFGFNWRWKFKCKWDGRAHKTIGIIRLCFFFFFIYLRRMAA